MKTRPLSTRINDWSANLASVFVPSFLKRWAQARMRERRSEELFDAANTGDLEAVRILLPIANARPTVLGITPLMIAAVRGDAAVVLTEMCSLDELTTS